MTLVLKNKHMILQSRDGFFLVLSISYSCSKDQTHVLIQNGLSWEGSVIESRVEKG